MIAAEADETAGSHAEEDENYFVSMTDMMVGILFIFIIMLMVFALNFQKQTDQTEALTDQQKEQIEKAQELAQQIAHLQAQIDSEISKINQADQARAVLLERIRERLEAVGLKVTIDSDTGVLRLTEDAIRFAQNSATLDDTAARNVDSLSKVLADILPAYAICAAGAACPAAAGYVVETVFIEGHTDTTGSDDRNWQLSTERAVNTYRRMVDRFPALRGLKNSGSQEILSVSGYAYTRPATNRDDSEGLKINRRIDLRFVMEADREKRLTEVLRLLENMNLKVDALQASAKMGAGFGWRQAPGRTR
ncbi:OmpA family protein [Mesorhizobium sp. GR13]|uniref:OmpA family protein n=1 Tax=Mesorhizobium sp. GR13 TaxID=2562308 RepID=UPI0010C03237|nr:OmpA family protein [Mesorhizobium sp. GR13]